MNKKVSNSRERILQLMEYYRINQTELCKRTGIQKSALSNYLNGDREPRQNQISLIADPFNINPAWLMGYDVPMEMPTPKIELNEETEEAIKLYQEYINSSPDIQRMVSYLLKVSQAIPDIPEIPHLKNVELPKPNAELPHLKKDKE